MLRIPIMLFTKGRLKIGVTTTTLPLPAIVVLKFNKLFCVVVFILNTKIQDVYLFVKDKKKKILKKRIKINGNLKK